MADVAIEKVAALFANSTRAGLCRLLMDGRYRTAGELARAVGVGPPSVSEHLARLVQAGVLGVTSQGRHRYFRLENPDAAAVIEALGLMAPTIRTGNSWRQVRAARTFVLHVLVMTISPVGWA